MPLTTTRVMDITTPLGDDVLLFHRMQASEELSRPFEYRLDLLSTRNDINLADVLGKSVTVKLALPDDSTRFFNGFVTRIAQGGSYGRYTRYFAVVRPWLWFLTRTTDCRVFQDMTVPEIVQQVFADHDTADFQFELTSTYRKWTYCVQYRATDFNFVSRLLEHEGIYLLQAHRRPQHGRPHRFDQQAHAAAGLRRFRSSRRKRWSAPSWSGSAAGTSRIKSSPAFTCTTTTISNGRRSR